MNDILFLNSLHLNQELDSHHPYTKNVDQEKNKKRKKTFTVRKSEKNDSKRERRK